jgi:hypothetical protein
MQATQINLSEKYDLTDIDGAAIHTILKALADTERMYRKAGLTGLADNASAAHKAVLGSIQEAK